jgi:hypothetical protein
MLTDSEISLKCIFHQTDALPDARDRNHFLSYVIPNDSRVVRRHIKPVTTLVIG